MCVIQSARQGLLEKEPRLSSSLSILNIMKAIFKNTHQSVYEVMCCFCVCVSAGEDGQLKIWSKSGMLRSTLAQQGTQHARTHTNTHAHTLTTHHTHTHNTHTQHTHTHTHTHHHTHH